MSDNLLLIPVLRVKKGETTTLESRQFQLVLRIVSLIVILSSCVYYWFYTVEDAFITFRYASNFEKFGELNYNRGEAVEGYTNFLWLLILSLCGHFFDIVICAQKLGMLFTICTVYLTGKMMMKFHDARVVGPLVSVLLVSSPGFALWSVSGLETAMFTFLLVAALYADLNLGYGQQIISGIIFGLAAITRPEGALFFLIYFFFKIVVLKQKKIWIFAAGFSAIFIPHLIIRYSLYHQWVPNTFWVKGKKFQGGGVAYFKRYLAMTGAIWLPIILLGISRIRRNKMLVFFLPSSLIYLTYVWKIGGDWMPMGRFLVPILPYALFGACLTIMTFQKKFRNAMLLGFCILNAGISLASYQYDILRLRPTRYHDLLRWEYYHFKDWKQIGLFFKDYCNEDQTLCTGLGGIIPYYSEVRTLDRSGLNDKEIAMIIQTSRNPREEKEKIDLAVLQRRPDIIIDEMNSFEILSNEVPDSEKTWNLHNESIFRQLYKRKTVMLNSKYLSFFERKTDD